MKRSTFLLVICVLSVLLNGFTGTYALEPLNTNAMLEKITALECDDYSGTLKHAVLMGKFADETEFNAALKANLKIKLENEIEADYKATKGSFSGEITQHSSKIQELDRDMVSNIMIDENKIKKHLFQQADCSFPSSYKATMDLVKKFNPRSKTNDHKKLNKDIDAYLNSIANTLPIQYALKVTKTDLATLKSNWFGSGLGFEHVIAGEVKGSKVSGYHWWYKFYRDELDSRAVYNKTLEGQNDPKIFTGSFKWDPDGNGNQFKQAYKKKGGFIIHSSAPALLALGHIAIEVAKKSGCPGSFSFDANINGNTYRWQMYTVGRSIRSLYPMVKRNKMEDVKKEAFDLIIEDLID